MDPKCTKKSLKRKLEEAMEGGKSECNKLKRRPIVVPVEDLVREITEQLAVLNSALSSSESDRETAMRAVNLLCELAKNEDIVDLIVDAGAVPILVKRLQPPTLEDDGQDGPIPFEHEVEKGCAFTLGLLAIKREYQQLIVDTGGLSLLVNLIKKHKTCCNSSAVNGLFRRVFDAITNLSHENANIKSLVRIEGAIPLLVEALEFSDIKVRRAAAGALRTLAFRNDQNKNQIVQSNALPMLIMMLYSEDSTVHFEAIGVIGNLVHSSPDIKKEVLLAGALQPVIELLSSSCSETQREAALLLGQFAATDACCKVHIAQRGAIPPLVEMLRTSDVQLKEMASFALGRLAQDAHSQAGIAHSGALIPLLRLLDSKNGALQHNSAFCVFALADNEDVVPNLIREGAVQRLQDGRFTAQQTKDCVLRTLKRLETKIRGQVLKRILCLMRDSDKTIQKRIALGLAHVSAYEYQKTIFIDNKGLELLLELFKSTNLKQQQDGSAALHKLAIVDTALHPADAAPQSPTTQVYLDEKYVNDPTLSDVTFFVEGKQFYAHKTCLLASSDAFRAMFDGGYKETNSRDVEIPNIKWDVFEAMMRFIYTGSIDINVVIVKDLLKAADQYLLDGLKRCCEHTISQDICVNNLLAMYELSETYNATSLRDSCLLFVLANFNELRTKPWFSGFLELVIPEIANYLTKVLTMPVQAIQTQ